MMGRRPFVRNTHARLQGPLLVTAWARALRFAPVRIELLLDDRLRPSLLTRRLMLCLELHLATLADSDHRNILDAFHDAKIAFGHALQSHTVWLVWGGQECPPHPSPSPCTQNAVMVTFRIVPDIRKGSEGVLSPKRESPDLRPAGVAQLVEHLICNQRVRGSNPFASSSIGSGRQDIRRGGGLTEFSNSTP